MGRSGGSADVVCTTLVQLIPRPCKFKSSEAIMARKKMKFAAPKFAHDETVKVFLNEFEGNSIVRRELGFYKIVCSLGEDTWQVRHEETGEESHALASNIEKL
jgi:hypothetical protein